MTETVLYFAYGSNMDPDRFVARVGPWRARFPARLEDHRLRFAASVRSEGGGGAVVDPSHGDVVDGVVFEISRTQLEALDREEFDPSRNTTGAGRRGTLEVKIGDRIVETEAYLLTDDGAEYPPSESYLGHILKGLTASGQPEEALDRVRLAARRAGARIPG